MKPSSALYEGNALLMSITTARFDPHAMKSYQATTTNDILIFNFQSIFFSVDKMLDVS